MEKVNVFGMMDQIRKLLRLTIEEFCSDMNWPNSNYYDAIKSGIRRPDGTKKPSSPTVNKLFDGINHAMETSVHWQKYRVEITDIVVKALFSPSTGK